MDSGLKTNFGVIIYENDIEKVNKCLEQITSEGSLNENGISKLIDVDQNTAKRIFTLIKCLNYTELSGYKSTLIKHNTLTKEALDLNKIRIYYEELKRTNNFQNQNYKLILNQNKQIEEARILSRKSNKMAKYAIIISIIIPLIIKIIEILFDYFKIKYLL